MAREVVIFYIHLVLLRAKKNPGVVFGPVESATCQISSGEQPDSPLITASIRFTCQVS